MSQTKRNPLPYLLVGFFSISILIVFGFVLGYNYKAKRIPIEFSNETYALHSAINSLEYDLHFTQMKKDSIREELKLCKRQTGEKALKLFLEETLEKLEK